MLMTVWCFYMVFLSVHCELQKRNRCRAVATWSFGELAVKRSAKMLSDGYNCVDAVEEGIMAVEIDNTDQYFVGIGGFPNSEGVMELDAAIMDGECKYGAVMALQDIINPISVARTVMEKCVHNVLVGDGALKWALSQGFDRNTKVLTDEMKEMCIEKQQLRETSTQLEIDRVEGSHDTIGLICMDDKGCLCCGTSTSGWAYKHPGRVGDAPLIGSGLYCDNAVGAAVATGDGEEIMRSCLSFLVVEHMRLGKSPQEACKLAIDRVISLKPSETGTARMHPQLTVGVIAMNAAGEIGAASTLFEGNRHRGQPWFPAVYWCGDVGPSELRVLQAGIDGASL